MTQITNVFLACKFQLNDFLWDKNGIWQKADNINGMTSFIRLFKDIVSLITLSRPFSTWHIQRIYTYSSLL